MRLAIIEDRISRLENLSNLSFDKIPEVKVISGQEFDDLIQQLKGNDLSLVQSFECIACHRSALAIEQREVIKRYCKEKKRPLIFFSGGISSAYFNDIDFPFLSINSKDFYSKHLELFINELRSGSVNLLLLQFGERWRLSLLLQLRDQLIVARNKGKVNRINDLRINSLMKSDLVKFKELAYLESSETAKLPVDGVDRLLAVLSELINDCL